jgi:hypothetical protein
MSQKNDGGPAFHEYYGTGTHPQYQRGMSLRDWFAGMALQGLLSNSHPQVVKSFARHNENAGTAFAESAYAFADDMLKARGE